MRTLLNSKKENSLCPPAERSSNQRPNVPPVSPPMKPSDVLDMSAIYVYDSLAV